MVPTLLLSAFVLGCLYATAMPATNRAIVTGVPVDRQGLAMGVKQVGVTAGSGVGTLLVTWFATTRFSWRGGFVAAAAAGLTFVVMQVGGSAGRIVTGQLASQASSSSDGRRVTRPEPLTRPASEGWTALIDPSISTESPSIDSRYYIVI